MKPDLLVQITNVASEVGGDSSTIRYDIHIFICFNDAICRIISDHDHGDPEWQMCGLNPAQKESVQTNARELYLGLSLIQQEEKNLYGRLQYELENDYTKGQNNYPITIVKAFQLLNDFRTSTVYAAKDKSTTGVAFSQTDNSNRHIPSKKRTPEKESNDRTSPAKEYMGCGEQGISVYKCTFCKERREKDKAKRTPTLKTPSKTKKKTVAFSQ